MGGVVEGGKEEGWQEATAKFRAPSSQDFPVAERTGGAAGDSAACLGAGVSGGAADPDLDLGGPRRGGEAGAPPRPRPAAAAPRAAAGAGGGRTTVAAAFDALMKHPGPRRAAGAGAAVTAAGTSAAAAVEPDAGGVVRPSSSSAVRFDIIMVSKIHNWNEARTVPPLGESWSADCGGGGGGGGGTPAAAAAA